MSFSRLWLWAFVNSTFVSMSTREFVCSIILGYISRKRISVSWEFHLQFLSWNDQTVFSVHQFHFFPCIKWNVLKTLPHSVVEVNGQMFKEHRASWQANTWCSSFVSDIKYFSSRLTYNICIFFFFFISQGMKVWNYDYLLLESWLMRVCISRNLGPGVKTVTITCVWRMASTPVSTDDSSWFTGRNVLWIVLLVCDVGRHLSHLITSSNALDCHAPNFLIGEMKGYVKR